MELSVVLDDRIALLEKELEDLTSLFEKENKEKQIHNPKFRTVGINMSDEMVGKIKSMVLEGHLPNMAAITNVIGEFIAQIEKENGPLPYCDPSTRLRYPERLGRKSSGKSLINQLKRQIRLLKTFREKSKQFEVPIR